MKPRTALLAVRRRLEALEPPAHVRDNPGWREGWEACRAHAILIANDTLRDAAHIEGSHR